MRHFRSTALALGAAVVLVGCSTTTGGHLQAPTPGGSSGSSGSAPSSTVTVPRAKFRDCGFNLAALGLPSGELSALDVGCAPLSVPLDYAKPDGEKTGVAMVRVHKSGAKTTGSLLVNPGGPGGSGVQLALGITGQLFNTLLDHFDLIGFDPRGVGLSTPIRCLTDAQKDVYNAASPDIRTSAGFTAAKQMAATVAKACETKYGAKLPYFNTVNTARDMDLIRQAVGDDKLNYLGFSYGTELGAQYLHLFPTRMRVAVLDGAVDPLTSDITQFADQLEGFESAFNQFAAYCTADPSCKRVGAPRTAVATVFAAANRSGGLPVAGDSRKLTSSLAATGVLEALYSRSSWPTLGTSLLQGLRGDGAGLLSLADAYNQRTDGRYSNLSDANLTISCNDSKPGPTDAQIRATATSWATRFPIFGVSNAATLFGCQQWQSTLRTVPPLPAAKTTPRKVLVIGNLHDPATPYQGAKDLTSTLGNAELLSWDGQGHTSYLQGSSCIDAKVNAYLESGTLPAANTTCPA